MVHDSEDDEKKDRYLVISGTNREGSHTEKVAEYYFKLLKSRGVPVDFFNMKNFNPLSRDARFRDVENRLLIPAKKFVFIIPEYNGSYPGVLKTMIDNTNIREVWFFKKALLTGVATGRAGNLRGMDHLADTLNYLRMTVHYNKLPISRIDHVMDSLGSLNQETRKAIEFQVDDFIDF